jgi:hypothetical protein
MIFVVSENRRYRKIRMEASSNVLRADMDVVEGLDVDASATRAEASIQGRMWDAWCPEGFVFARETANKSARGETSTEYVFAFVVVAIVVFATYLSLLNI